MSKNQPQPSRGVCIHPRSQPHTPEHNHLDITVLQERYGHIHMRLEEILQQVKRTNGRVTRLELWRSYILGGLGTLVAALGFFLK